MTQEQLRQDPQIYAGKKFDVLKITKESQKVVLEKEKTGIAGILYFAVFLTACIVIGFFGTNWMILTASALIALSSAGVIFLDYTTELDFDQKEIRHEKKFLLIRFRRIIPFSQILDFKIKSGEMGYNLKVKTGQSEILFYKIWQELTLCRIEKYEDSVEILNWIREQIRPK